MTEEKLEARQMAALSEWLEQGTVTAHEAACLLAGVLPPERAGDDRDFGAWLPGCEAWAHAREAWAFRVKAKIAHIETILREDESRHDQSPEAYLALGAKRGFQPPWFDPARADPACHSLLPGELQTAPPAERPIQAANRKKAEVRWTTDDKTVVMKNAGRAEFNKLRAAGFAGCTREDGSPIIIQVALAVLEAIRKIEPDPAFHPVPRTAERYVKKWLAEDRPDNAGAQSDNAGAYVAK
ncbi:MAG TPA: hypothetical protein DEO85_08395 [Maritimibacter sp.]|nr:hypothetical protein [Maritimibacter sp.]